jgi:predicted metal-dependent hydrolase
VTTLNEALPLVKDPHLAHDIRGFIGQEAMHADVHEQVLHEYLVVNGIDPKADARPGRVRLRKGFGANDIHRSQAATQPPVRPAVVDRGDPALHRRAG